MELEVVAKALKELGHPTRLSIYKSVVKAGFQGIAVGAIQEQLNIPGVRRCLTISPVWHRQI